MNDLYLSRPFATNCACLKVLNERGEELSVAFDDSCGALKHLGRVSIAVFKSAESSENVRDEVFCVGAKELLEELALHLGYTLTKAE